MPNFARSLRWNPFTDKRKALTSWERQVIINFKNRFTMAVKIRLQRHGKKNFAFFHIVVADTRAPRDGRYIEQLGSYNPNTNPATITLDSEKALNWLKVGAQLTLVTRRLLSYEGVLLRFHLQKGVDKGALTQEQADQKWNAWKAQRDAKIVAKKEGIAQSKQTKAKAALDAEKKVNAERAEALAKKAEELAEQERKAAEEAAAEAAEAPAAESAPEAKPEA
jgi:small subunit ribosomal protein S16